MADNKTSIIISAEDRTAAAFASAIVNERRVPSISISARSALISIHFVLWPKRRARASINSADMHGLPSMM